MMANRQLPPLEELSLSAFDLRANSWYEPYCIQLRASMDWSRLRKLDFDHDNHAPFFQIFEGVLPQLKSLRFGFPRPSYGGDPPLEQIRRFIESIKALQCLDVYNAKRGLDVLWPSIILHKESLNRLILGNNLSTHEPKDVIDLRVLKTISKEFRLLEHFGCMVPFGKMVGCPVPPSYHTFV